MHITTSQRPQQSRTAVNPKERTKPKLAPDEVSNMLFGPGVIAEINKKVINEKIRLAVMNGSFHPE
ncbi:hypothetical protein B738_00951 [Photorhabdus temperata subsp. temperata M1021]|nr:hypothetical protein B738_00951 [Photorhabdus temperata subsp. temperata M1021]